MFWKKVSDLKESVYLLNSFNQSNITELKKKLYISTFKLGIFKRKKDFLKWNRLHFLEQKINVDFLIIRFVF